MAITDKHPEEQIESSEQPDQDVNTAPQSGKKKKHGKLFKAGAIGTGGLAALGIVGGAYKLGSSSGSTPEKVSDNSPAATSTAPEAKTDLSERLKELGIEASFYPSSDTIGQTKGKVNPNLVKPGSDAQKLVDSYYSDVEGKISGYINGREPLPVMGGVCLTETEKLDNKAGETWTVLRVWGNPLASESSSQVSFTALTGSSSAWGMVIQNPEQGENPNSVLVSGNASRTETVNVIGSLDNVYSATVEGALTFDGAPQSGHIGAPLYSGDVSSVNADIVWPETGVVVTPQNGQKPFIAGVIATTAKKGDVEFSQQEQQNICSAVIEATGFSQ